MQCLSSWDANAGSPLMLAGLPSWGPSPWWLAVHTLVWFFPFRFFLGGGILGESLPDLFHVHCSDKTQNCAENHASWEQFLRVIWKVVFQAVVLSLAQIKFFSYCWLFLLTDVFVWLCFLTNIISLFFYFFSALLKSQRWMPSTEKV